jgi:RNA polymerase sigma-70 factor (ECF subfamily)
MDNASLPTGETTRLLARFREGDRGARNLLIERSYQQFRKLASQMLHQFPALRRWEQTGDVLHKAQIRLIGALEEINPESSSHFHRLAALAIRRELLDLKRHHFGPLGQASRHDTRPFEGPISFEPCTPDCDGPPSIAALADFDEAIDDLPEECREVALLILYKGMTREEVAECLGVHIRTIGRRWRVAKRLLAKRLGLVGDDLSQ